MNSHRPPGHIITFYSYKGGTGRTMLLANVAWILASAGKRVLTIDWDLEAPGLHEYFRPFLIDSSLSATDGLIDMVVDYSNEAVTPLENAEDSPHWLEQAANVERYIVSTDWDFANSGQLHILAAGRQNASYPVRINTFNWQDFYDRLNGGAFLELVKQKVRQDYDYVLIDSRTGVSDTSGICTVQMPDQLVVCFTANEQNVKGSVQVAATVKKQWDMLDEIEGSRANQIGTNPRRILPVLTRIEQSEKEKLDAARTYIRSQYRTLLGFAPHAEEAYWRRAEVSYWPYYAFEEVLAVFGDKFRTETSLLVACETIAELISYGQVRQADLPSSEQREKVLRLFERSTTAGSAAPIDRLGEKGHDDLHETEETHANLRVFLSGPGDVAEERSLCRLLLKDELPYDPFLRGRVSFDVVSWDDPVVPLQMPFNSFPQEAVNRFGPKPSQCDIVVVVLWSRMGTPLDPVELGKKPGGGSYLSGTEWEFEDAWSGWNAHKRPDILVYRRTEEPRIGVKDPQLAEKLRQYDLVEHFFERFKNLDGSLRGAWTAYTTPTEFKERLARDLKHLVSTRLLRSRGKIDTTSARAAVPDWLGSPYPGQRPFSAEEAPIFFGREREVDALISRLRDPAQRFLAIVGASGSGKSSLVYAGLLPRLAAGAIEGSQHWALLTLTPSELGDNPLLPLASELERILPAHEQISPHKVARMLVQNAGWLKDHVDTLLEGRPPDAVLVLIIDQLEELFTHTAENHRHSFIEILAQAATNPRLRVIATLRADFLPQCAANPALALLLQAGTFVLGAPGPAALTDMIRKPAQRAGIDLEEGLADEILMDAGGDPGALPLVAFCLNELYWQHGSERRLTLNHYRDMGGLRGAISRRIEALLVEFQQGEAADLESVMPQVFAALVHVDAAGKAARQRASRDDLMAAPSPIPQLIEKLIAGRVLLTEDIGGRAVVMLANEALLREWPALNEWLRVNHTQLQRLQRVFESLTSSASRDRAYAAEVLGEIGPVTPEVVPALITALSDADAEVRSKAASALREIGPVTPEVVPALITALSDADAEVRSKAASALGNIEPAAAGNL
jgi:MinD-like ATPase involved in chromosome partitioning or flagellar assembly